MGQTMTTFSSSPSPRFTLHFDSNVHIPHFNMLYLNNKNLINSEFSVAFSQYLLTPVYKVSNSGSCLSTMFVNSFIFVYSLLPDLLASKTKPWPCLYYKENCCQPTNLNHIRAHGLLLSLYIWSYATTPPLLTSATFMTALILISARTHHCCC